MSKYIGADEKIGFKKEGTRGTAEASATFYLPVLSCGFEDSKEEVIDEQGYGVIEDSVGSKIATKWAEGPISFNCNDETLGLLLYNVLGTLSTAADTPDAGSNTHTITVSQTHQHQALTIFLKDTNRDLKFALGMINTFTIDAALGAFVKVTCEFISKIGVAASTSPAYSAENLFIARDVVVKVAANLAGLGAASDIKARNVSVTINKDLLKNDVLGSGEPDDILNKRPSFEIAIELDKSDDTYSDLNLAETYKALRIEMTNSDVTIGVAANPKLTIDFARAKIQSVTTSRGLGDIVTETIIFKGFYSLTDTKAITIALINETTSY